MRLLVLLVLVIASYAVVPLTVRLVAEGFDSPLYITHAPGDSDRLFVVERLGKIKIVRDGGVISTFLDITSLVKPGHPFYSEQGLLGLTFHPDYQTNGRFFVYYTSYDGSAGDTKLARYQVSSDPNVADPTGVVIMSISQPYTNHNGGWIDFGPDGYLYISSGDGGAGNNPINSAQDPNNLLGSILRIDVNTGLYSVPSDNPIPGNPVWAYGLRNSWRCSFDRLNGDLYIADVGQEGREEIDVQSGSSSGGENYGWRCMEGTTCTGLSGCVCNDSELVLPIHEYDHLTGCSVTGGYVYRGSKIPTLQGHYVFGDYCSGYIWTFQYIGGTVHNFIDRTAELTSDIDFGFISSFGEDAEGEIYFSDLQNGKIFQIIPVTPCENVADFNGDCDVDITDLSQLLVKWGPCIGCSEDLNKDGVVDVQDLATLLTNWG